MWQNSKILLKLLKIEFRDKNIYSPNTNLKFKTPYLKVYNKFFYTFICVHY